MFLGIDTSNYTTSLALYDSETIIQEKQILQVKPGEKGLRQSDALFQHTVNLPILFDRLSILGPPHAVAVSARPRNIAGSYMPCFLAGVNAATACARTLGVPLYQTSHQIGHILAALYSAKQLDLIHAPFLAFHVSGGTTEALYVKPHTTALLDTEIVARSTDLKAGQAIDRTGVMLDLSFPCGAELDALSLQSERTFVVRPSLQGENCSLSGVENKAKQMLTDGESAADIAKFVLTYIAETLLQMTKRLVDIYGNLPIVYSGGVMSNTLIRARIQNAFPACFAKPQFSCDNAAGIAIYAALKETK